MLRELAGSDVPTYAARGMREEGTEEPASLVVLNRYTTAGEVEEQEALAEAVEEATLWKELAHENVARVIEVVPSAREVLVVSDFVDGWRYAEVLPTREAFGAPSFALKLGIVVDVMEGLAKLHSLASSRRASTVHGAVTPHNVIVCADGKARLVRVCNLFPEQLSPVNPALGYFAPERLDPARMPDARGDVYGLGVLLWEVLCGKRLAVQSNLSSLLLREFETGSRRADPAEHLGGRVPSSPSSSALAPAEARYPTAAAMAEDVRKVLAEGERASAAAIAQFIEAHHGEAIRARRQELSTCAPKPTSAARATLAPKRSLRPPRAERRLDAVPPPPPVANVTLDASPPPVAAPAAPPAAVAPAALAAAATPSPIPESAPAAPVSEGGAPASPPAAASPEDDVPRGVPPRRGAGGWSRRLVWAPLLLGAIAVLVVGVRWTRRDRAPSHAEGITGSEESRAAPRLDGEPKAAEGTEEATELEELEASEPAREFELDPDPASPKNAAPLRRAARPAPPATSASAERKKFNPQGI